jgi:hypothetical protein
VSKFLINENFIQVSCNLMLEIGQSRAIVFQKLYSITGKKKQYLATYQDLHSLMPFISIKHLKRILVWLESQDLIVCAQEKGKRSKWYSINFESLASQGFEIIESCIFPKNYKSKKLSFILPSLVSLVGITSGIFLQDFYYKNGSNYSQMTQKEINKWVPYVGLRQVEILFHNLQSKGVIKSEFRDGSNKHDGKYYLINKQKIDEMLSCNTTKVCENSRSNVRSLPVDNSASVDNFASQMDKRSGLSGQKIGTYRTKDRDYSIDQDQVKIFKENNTNIMGRKPDCGTIPIMKDNVVFLKERLMTHGIQSIESERLISKFGEQRVKEVLAAALRTEKSSGKSVHGNWIIKALHLNWNLKENSKGKEMTRYISPEDSKYKRELDESTELALKAIDSLQRSSNDVGEYYLKLLRKKLPKTSSRSNREFAKDIATNVVDIYSRSESSETDSALTS